MRSRTGCLTCRARKLKCDETKPICGQCTKAKRSCQHGPAVTFRHQQNASLNGEGRSDSGTDESLKTFYAYRNTFRDDHIWLAIPPQITFVYVQDPYLEADSVEVDETVIYRPESSRIPHGADRVTAEMQRTPESPLASSPMQRLEALSAAASIDSYSTPPQQSGSHEHSRAYPSPQQPQNSPTTSLQRAAGGSVAGDGLQTPLRGEAMVDLDASPLEPQRPLSSAREGSKHAIADMEIAFLLRHYSEGPGFGMDLFDCGNYFSTQVPIKAVSHPILMNAACAYAAKHLDRVRGVKAPYGGNCTKQARMEVWPHKGKPDWDLVAFNYYDSAIKLLVAALGKQQQHRAANGPDSTASVPTNTPDELLAATAILCEYEAMDMSDAAWSRHLDGTKTLLEIAEVGMRPAADHERLGLGENSRLFAGSRKAIFWNFARQDFASAFISQCPTRLDVTNRKLWIAAGLDLDENGRLLHSSDPISRYGNDTHSREDMIANSLILIMSKLNNYIILTGDESSAEELSKTRPPAKRAAVDAHLALSQQTLLSMWRRLKEELDTWHANLPDTFAPAARVPHPIFSELWYPIPMVASAMQNYHMARILLLINKPHESTARRTTVTGRLQSYQAIANEIRRHAYTVVAIALARPEAAARIFSIQPLYVAGQCLTETRERRVVLDLLRGIEHDLGWATEWRINQLFREWESNDGG